FNKDGKFKGWILNKKLHDLVAFWYYFYKIFIVY
ncbi:MAG: hypothetical protein JWQ30_1691, partial [Sediminibacterium sp.]|nr:hypothetical protein [Sediminibacterium sp.]